MSPVTSSLTRPASNPLETRQASRVVRPRAGRLVGILVALVLLLMGHSPASAQVTGNLEILVTSADTGAPLSGVQIGVEGIGRGGITMSDGLLRLEGVPAGRRYLRIESVGLRTERVPVEVIGGATLRVSVQMQFDPVVLDGFRVVSYSGRLLDSWTWDRQARDSRDLFADEAAVEIGGGTRVAQRLYLRGMEATQMQVTVDGARQGQNLFNHRGGLPNIDPDLLRRVDLQPGPPAADQGHGALGGSIRLETVDAQDRLGADQRLGGLVRTRASSVDDGFGGSVGAWGRIGESGGILAYHSRTSREDFRTGSGDAVPFSGGEDRATLFRASAIDVQGHSLRVGLERHEAGGLNFMQRGDYPWQLQPDPENRPPRDMTLAREAFTGEWRWEPGQGSPLAQIRLYRSDTDLSIDTPATQRFSSSVRGFDARTVVPWGYARVFGRLSVGVDGFEDQGEAWRPDREPRVNRYRNVGLFAQQRLDTGPVRLWFGVRRDDFTTRFGQSNSGNAATLFNLGGEVDLLGRLHAFAGWGQAARGAGSIPVHFAQNVVADALFNGELGGTIDPERSELVEAGLRWIGAVTADGTDRLEVEVFGFHTRIRDPIQYLQPGSGGLGGRPVTEIFNGDQSPRVQGAEIRAHHDLGRLRWGLTAARSEIRDLPPEPQFIARFGAPMGDRGVLTTDLVVTGDLRVGQTLTVVRRLREVPPDQQVFIPRPGYTTLDLRATWEPERVTGLTVSATLRNALDRSYAGHSTFTQNGLFTEEPGRDLRIGVGIRF